MLTIEKEHPSYPCDLNHVVEPPERLWVRGDPGALNEGKRIAIVGTRRATSYGGKVAFELAFQLAGRGITVVSGLAYGIDTEAHRGALEAGGRTIAVLGCGMNIPYPANNLGLKERISRSGAVITEFEPEERATEFTFPRRNRIISGLSVAVVVVEAAFKSGALVTANWALSQGKEVFAVPGPIDSPVSQGTNRLIQNGAPPLLGVEDLFGVLQLPFNPPQSKRVGLNSSSEEERILGMMTEACSIDEIVDRSGMNVGEVGSLLVMLEIDRKVKALPGGLFQRVSHG